MSIVEELKRLIEIGSAASVMLCEIDDATMFKCSIASIIDQWANEHDGNRLDLIDEIKEMMYAVPEEEN